MRLVTSKNHIFLSVLMNPVGRFTRQLLVSSVYVRSGAWRTAKPIGMKMPIAAIATPYKPHPEGMAGADTNTRADTKIM